MRSVDSMCLVETERTEKEVWSWERKAQRSDLETCLISVRSFSNFWGVLAGVDEELKQEVVRRYSRIGDLVIATVKKADPNADPQVGKGKIVLALIVATHKGKKKRKIVKVVKEPVGTRIFVPLLAEFDQATTYQEAINDENIDRHDKKTDKYNSKGAKEKFEDLKKLHEQIEALQKNPTPTAEEKAELTKKKEEYNDKLKQAKKDTIENIQDQLAQNKLSITELDDNRNC
ncbi:11325_t:CDS:2 [Racocetra fulgida]|uniref:11325_t:CDS:1 n=1 Tax=Racocetra fulgida TaxID=60492 RepID=A0A9N8VDS1_9GLOM|nr:11325_t:CDS:2 [Racocetra fulgida]